jgi:L-fucose mutarotase
MLKGLHPLLGSELLHMLASAGHGDVLALVDRNYPAYSADVPVVRVDGADTSTLAEAILTVLPVDTFVESPVFGMQPVTGDERPASHVALERLIEQAEGRFVAVKPLAREDFYRAAQDCFGVIVTSDPRPYSCFLLSKGVV